MTPCENTFENFGKEWLTDLWTNFAISILATSLTFRMLRRSKHGVTFSRQFKEHIARTALFCSNCSFLRCDAYVEPQRIIPYKTGVFNLFGQRATCNLRMIARAT